MKITETYNPQDQTFTLRTEGTAIKFKDVDTVRYPEVYEGLHKEIYNREILEGHIKSLNSKYLYGDYDKQTEQKDTEEMADKKLYEVELEGKTKYVTKIGIGQDGRWVVEPKGGGEPFAVDKDTLKEVIPYVIGVTFPGNRTVYHYKAEKGKYKVGEILAVDQADIEADRWGLVRVAEVGVTASTKVNQATKELTGVVLSNLS